MRRSIALILFAYSACCAQSVFPPPAGGGGGATPTGPSGAVQFNNAGALGGSADLQFYPYAATGLKGLFVGDHTAALGPFAVGISVFPALTAVENHWGFEAPSGSYGFSEQEYDTYNPTTGTLQDLFYTGVAATLSGDTVSDYSYYIESTPDYVPELAVRPHFLTVRRDSRVCWDSSDTTPPVDTLQPPTADACLTRPSANTIRFTDGASGLATLQASRYQETLHTPASSSEACTAGQFSDDASFHYVCTATNTWKRVALSSF